MIEILGEIGVNHNGDLLTAYRLVDAAIEAGCTAVKTQLFDSERVYTGDKVAEMKKLELDRRAIRELKVYCDSRQIELIVTPDEIGDAVFLKDIGVKRIKTSSQDVTNIPFLKAVAALGLPMIVSTGACSWLEMNRAIVAVMGEITSSRLTVLHCVSAYPAPLAQMNLKGITRLRAMTYSKVGLSDHTTGCEAAVMALALGATTFEKHITLDARQDGPDHAASMEPDGMAHYVKTLKECEGALGDGIKRVMLCELENRKWFEEFVARRKALI